MILDIRPVLNNKDFRYLYFGQLISFFGSMISYVAVPYQIYEITKSNAQVGLLSLAQLLPVVAFGLLGGAVADRMDRKKLLIISEIIMCLCALGLWLNSHSASPSILAVFILVIFMQSANGFHRPALEALTQKLVTPSEYGAVSALNSFRSTLGAVAGPALGGLLIAKYGTEGAYLFDVVTFVLGLILICLINNKKMMSEKKQNTKIFTDLKEGLSFALRNPTLMGTYIIDIVAMTFAFPVALFPAMAEGFGGAKAAGYLFSAMALGSFVIAIFSGWTAKIKSHGKAVIIAATFWAFFIFLLGFSTNLYFSLFCLALAGGADMISGIYRGIIWNETIPNEKRGRLAGIEMISYMTGPLLGNARAGVVASFSSIAVSVWTGGLICIIGVMVTGYFLPRFWSYKATS